MLSNLCQNDDHVMHVLSKKYSLDLSQFDLDNKSLKKVTGYILFSTVQYNNNDNTKIKLNSKIISSRWKNINAEERELYNLIAKNKLGGNKIKRKRMVKDPERIKIRSKGNTDENEKHYFKYTCHEISTELRKVGDYIVDCFDNIIDPETGMDIGYITGNGTIKLIP